MNIRNSGPYLVFAFLIGLFILGLVITILMYPVGKIYNMTYNDTAVQDDVYQQFFTRFNTTWIWLPFIMLLIAIFWIYIKSHENMGGYQ